MRVLYKCSCATVFLMPLVLSSAACAMVIEDGQVHVIDYRVYEPLSIRCDPSYHAPTGVTLRDPAITAQTIVYDNCSLRVVGGTGGNLYSLDDSSVLIEGGSFNRLVAFDQSTVEITGGLFRATDCSLYLGANVNTHVSTVTISGGTFQGVIDMKNFYGFMTISGGEFHKAVNFEDGARGRITGGSFRGKEIELSESAQLTLCGSDFKVDGAPVMYGTVYEGQCAGLLTGVLADGTPIETLISTAPGTTIEFSGMPEPATVVILGLGGLALRRRRIALPSGS